MQEFSKEIKFYVNIDKYVPERPAPNCQNHDSPRFSDSGDDEECEYTLFIDDPDRPGEKKEVIQNSLYALVDEDVRAIAREICNGGAA